MELCQKHPSLLCPQIINSLALAEVEVVYIDMYISYIQKSGELLGGGGKLGSYVSASRLCRVGGGGLIRAFIAFVR